MRGRIWRRLALRWAPALCTNLRVSRSFEVAATRIPRLQLRDKPGTEIRRERLSHGGYLGPVKGLEGIRKVNQSSEGRIE